MDSCLHGLRKTAGHQGKAVVFHAAAEAEAMVHVRKPFDQCRRRQCRVKVSRRIVMLQQDRQICREIFQCLIQNFFLVRKPHMSQQRKALSTVSAGCGHRLKHHAQMITEA